MKVSSNRNSDGGPDFVSLAISYLKSNQFKTAKQKKKRQRDTTSSNTDASKPNKRAAQHTGYSLYVHENYEMKKAMGNDMSSKDIRSQVDKQWSQIGEQEQQAWQCKAERLKQAAAEEAAVYANKNTGNISIEEVGLPEPPPAPDGTEDWDSRKRPTVPRKLSSSAADKSDQDHGTVYKTAHV